MNRKEGAKAVGPYDLIPWQQSGPKIDDGDDDITGLLMGNG